MAVTRAAHLPSLELTTSPARRTLRVGSQTLPERFCRWGIRWMLLTLARPIFILQISACSSWKLTGAAELIGLQHRRSRIQFVWNGGTVSGAGTVTIANNGSSVPNFVLGDSPFGSTNWTLDGMTLDNEGQAIVSHSDSGGFAMVNGAQFVNAGTLTTENAAYFPVFTPTGPMASALNNTGTITARGGRSIRNRRRFQ